MFIALLKGRMKGQISLRVMDASIVKYRVNGAHIQSVSPVKMIFFYLWKVKHTAKSDMFATSWCLGDLKVREFCYQ